jgi:predicted amidohydrolase
MRVALVQLDIAWEDPATNRRRAERRLQEAAACGARLAILPEMFATGFSMDAGRFAEPAGGPTESWLAETAAGLGLHVIAGVARTPGPENHALWCSPEGEVHAYSKLHPFSFAGEHEHYVAGDTVRTWLIDGLRVTPFVCYDLRFPEPFRLVTAATDVYVVIANWPERRRLHWQTLLRARAIENLAYVVGVNRCGEGGGLSYAGDSAVFSPWGEALVTAAGAETVLVADVDPKVVADARAAFPVLADRRSTYTGG